MTPQPIPTTAAEAAEPFRCIALACALAGRACGLRHAETTRKPAGGEGARRDACFGCPAGAARMALLDLAAKPAWRPPRPSRRESYLNLPPPRGWHE